ncbi:hypothetical protein SDC9_197661 [bioreactor metagenome]|uniref:Uncharacterized protein n=1 Tax=bioreactor metagenome TaxID=1076179 RepID=A0A645IGE3_9ZZZZ
MEGNGGQGLAFPFNFHAFFGFDGLMQPIGVTAAKHQAAGKLINNDNFAFTHHIIAVPLHDSFGSQCLIKMMRHFNVGIIIKIGNV